MRQMERRLKLQKIARILAMLLTCAMIAVISLMVAREMASVRTECLCVAALSISTFFIIIAVNIAMVVKKRREEAEGMLLLNVFNKCGRLVKQRELLKNF